MGDVGEYWRDVKEDWQKIKRDKKRNNIAGSTHLLHKNNIEFESKNNGIHLIVKSDKGFIDFWPSTGKFHVRDTGFKGRGVKQLISMVNR